MRQGLIDAVKRTTEEELTAANKAWRQFASTHEGYAVILEEAQEAEVELQKVARQIAIIWEMTKQNAPHEEIKAAADVLEQTAQNMAAEAIQTAAMARKLLDYLESVKEFEE